MTLFTLGGLAAVPASNRADLLAPSTRASLEAAELLDAVGVVEIDPAVSDTAAAEKVFGLSMDTLANCVIVGGKRERTERIAACLVLATGRADVNNVVKRRSTCAKPLPPSGRDGAQRHGVRRYHPHRAPRGLADPD